MYLLTEHCTYHVSVSLREADVQTIPPSEITTGGIYWPLLEEKLQITRQPLPERTTFLVSVPLHC